MPRYCAQHRKDHHLDLKSRKCRQEGCDKRATYRCVLCVCARVQVCVCACVCTGVCVRARARVGLGFRGRGGVPI